ncbi:transposase [Crateriforma conspicua]|uniref:transposase n=1 Tax=Crateriforma conspicua TaxID=2527996 RepID=UPI00118C3B70|nr:transposase [Crateriforma conspicua]QDV63586.1 Transposase IS200 like protein [Crateriforma conspicua]
MSTSPEGTAALEFWHVLLNQEISLPGTHHQLLYHFVFSTKNRRPYLQPETKDKVFEYLGGTARGLGGVPIRVGGHVDHVHLLVKLTTKHCIADFKGVVPR